MKPIAPPVLLFITVAALCFATFAWASCGGIDCKDPKNAGSAKCVTEQAAIDCTTQAAQDYITAHGGDLSQFFGPNGIDWTGAEAKLVALGVDFGICVLEKEIEHYLGAVVVVTLPDAGVGSAAGSGTGSGSAPGPAPAQLKSDDVRAKADALETKLYPGKKAKLAPSKR